RDVRALRLNQAYVLGEQSEKGTADGERVNCHQRLRTSALGPKNDIFSYAAGVGKVFRLKAAHVHCGGSGVLQAAGDSLSSEWPFNRKQDGGGRDDGAQHNKSNEKPFSCTWRVSARKIVNSPPLGRHGIKA